MGGLSRFHDGGAFATAIPLSIISATAAGTGDATEVVSSYVDVRKYQSAKLVLIALSTIAANKELDVTAGLKDATDTSGTGGAAFGTGVTAKKMDGSTGALTAHYSVMELDYNLAACRGYIASDITPDLTASGTDTTILSATLLLFGAAETPITARVN